jgi:TonB family protein
MQKAGWALALLALLAGSAWAQQEATAPRQAQTTAPAFAHSTPATGPDAGVPPACPAQYEDSLATNGIVGKDLTGVKPPKAKFMPAAQFSDEARKEIKKQHIKNFEAISLLGLIVDSNGNPQDVCLKKSAGYDLDAQAAKAVWQYRFEPAVKDGKPVPVRITIEVNFRIY